jgi:hypothetical protein
MTFMVCRIAVIFIRKKKKGDHRHLSCSNSALLVYFLLQKMLLSYSARRRFRVHQSPTG